MISFFFNYCLIGLGVYFAMAANNLGDLVRDFDKMEWVSLFRGFLLGILVWPIMLTVVGVLAMEKEKK